MNETLKKPQRYTADEIRQAKRVQVEGSNAMVPIQGCTREGVRISQFGATPVPFYEIVAIER